MVRLLDDIYRDRVTAEDTLSEMVRQLLKLRDEQNLELATVLSKLKQNGAGMSLSAEAIVTLIEQHLKLPNASRLPVLIVAAAYKAAQANLGERFLPLESHNAADSQTGSLGDVEITLIDDDKVISSYEMKDKRVTVDDINHALHKISDSGVEIEHYVFITTDVIEPEIVQYAAGIYASAGIEVVVLDCIGFLRHFLHLFHRLRMQYLEEYQLLVLSQPDSSVSHSLKQAFLVLRQATQSG